MSKQSPLQKINATFGSKKDLATKLAAVLEPREGETKDELAARLLHVSNGKLIHLQELADKVQKHGGKAQLIDAIATAEKKTKDADYRKSLESRSLGWLVDRAEAHARRQKAAAKKA